MALLDGYIYDITGTPVNGASVSFCVLRLPTIDENDQGILHQPFITMTNEDGYFSISLLDNTLVDVKIPSINYRRTLLVPETNSNLFDVE